VSTTSRNTVCSLASQRRKHAQDEASARLLDAAVELLRELPFKAVTMGAVAARAEISPAAARRLIPSVDELIAEVCLRRIRSISPHTEHHCGTVGRIASQLQQMVMAIAEEPGLAAACAAVLVDANPSIGAARKALTAEIHHLVSSAVGPGGWPEVITTLELTFSGALMQAGAGVMTCHQAARSLETAVDLILDEFP
jgi:AcrR family transcriptional regulator